MELCHRHTCELGWTPDIPFVQMVSTILNRELKSTPEGAANREMARSSRPELYDKCLCLAGTRKVAKGWLAIHLKAMGKPLSPPKFVIERLALLIQMMKEIVVIPFLRQFSEGYESGQVRRM